MFVVRCGRRSVSRSLPPFEIDKPSHMEEFKVLHCVGSFSLDSQEFALEAAKRNGASLKCLGLSRCSGLSKVCATDACPISGSPSPLTIWGLASPLAMNRWKMVNN